LLQVNIFTATADEKRRRIFEEKLLAVRTFQLKKEARAVRRAIDQQLLDDYAQRFIARQNVKQLQATRIPAPRHELKLA